MHIIVSRSYSIIGNDRFKLVLFQDEAVQFVYHLKQFLTGGEEEIRATDSVNNLPNQGTPL